MIQPPEVPAVALAATTIAVGGVATGLDYPVLLAGFAGGLVSLSFLPPMSVWRRIWTPVTATLMAGYTAPIGAHYLRQTSDVDGTALELFAGFTIGLAAQFIIPVVIEAARERAKRIAAGPKKENR